ncbi:MAG: type I-C CRISPR-associated protein Cas8c/Csd1 [Deltaproteobacteria bacterium]|nr:type I-C CRISPR-associated protein Cas8c/Csd1 [Deltaproteobacteria bacterium]
MILQALCEYYERARGETGVPEPGFSRQKIHFAIVINGGGNLLQVRDLRVMQKNKPGPKELIVPEPVKRTSGIAANFAWDNTMYALGATRADKAEHAKAFTTFKTFNHEVGDGVEDEGMRALLRFLDTWQPSKAADLDNWEEMAGLNVVFQLDGDLGFIHDRPKVRDAWSRYRSGTTSGTIAPCLVTGEKAPIARLHPAIKRVDGTQPSGAAIVSFNLGAFCSYGKKQNYNAPVGEASAFAYTTALNHLLRFGSRQRIQIGDATTVFWTSRASPVEGFMGMILSPGQDAAELQDLRSFLTSLKEGRMPPGVDPDVRFYILGLSPNISRISIRFWYASTVGDILDKVGWHFRDLAIVKSFDRDPDFPAVWQLLQETAFLRKGKNIPPVLGGALMRSILTGLSYPQGLYSVVLGRIRADREINYLRAAIIKAFLVRKYRIMNVSKEVTMTLNTEETNIAYRLGRLFAVLEKAQRDAVPGANTTIKDRFYGAASATPRAVFPQLLRTAQHHIQKAEYGSRSDKLIEEILQGVQGFPAHLSLDDQGHFALGYYHQRQAFFAKRSEQ